MTVYDFKIQMDALRVDRIQSYISLASPILAAFLAMRKNRSIPIWVVVTFLLPFIAPFGLIPLDALFPHLKLMGSYGIYTSIVRLLAGPMCLVFLLVRPAGSSPRANQKRDLVYSLLFFVFLVAAVTFLAFLFFPAQS